MRLLMIAPMLLLLAPGGEVAGAAADPPDAAIHTLCGDDTIAPSASSRAMVRAR